MHKKIKYFLWITALFYCSTFLSQSNNGNDIWIIVHGTFAEESLWYKPKGYFFETLKNVTKNHVYSFNWSGRLSAIARRDAGIEFKDFLNSIAQPKDRIHIIAHSHGGNVSIIAATYLSLSKSKIFIEELILLGTPIPLKLKIPDMNRIKKIYNFFSYGDKIQPVLRRFKRTLSYHPNIFNIQLKIKNKYPSHIDMHHIFIAHYAPFLKNIVHKNDINNFVININSLNDIEINEDPTREQDLKIDSQLIERILEIIADPYRKIELK